MISANVSGRGTPNVSGRDTPLSQVFFVLVKNGSCHDFFSQNQIPMSQYRFQVEGAEAPMPEGRQELPGTYKKQKQDISESFYKFEIRNLLDENETKSVISGTSVFKDDIDHDAGN